MRRNLAKRFAVAIVAAGAICSRASGASQDPILEGDLEYSPKKEPQALVTTPAWLFIPRLRLEEVFTDNANDSAGARESDFISIAGLGGRLSADTPRLQLDADYLASFAVYLKNSNQDHTSQQLHAKGQATVVPDFLFLDFHAVADRLRRDIGGTLGPADLNASNSVQTYILSVSPYAKYQIDHLGDVELRYGSNYTWFGDTGNGAQQNLPPVGDASQQQGKAEFTMPGTLVPRLLSDVFASDQYTNAPATIGNFRRFETQGVNEYQVTRSYSLVVAGGYESLSDIRASAATGEDFTAAAGFRWRPNPDSSVLLTYGRYDLKNDFAGEIQFQLTPETLLYAAYTDSISSSQQQLAGGTGASAFIQNGNLTASVLHDEPIAGVTFDQNPVIATLNKKFIQQENAQNGTATDLSNLSTLTGVPVLDIGSYFPIQNALFRLRSSRAILYRLIGRSWLTLQAFHNHRGIMTGFLPAAEISTGGRATYSTALSRYFTVFGAVDYQRLSNEGLFAQGPSTAWEASVGAHYDLAENARAFARYDFSRHEADSTGIATLQNSFDVGVALSF